MPSIGGTTRASNPDCAVASTAQTQRCGLALVYTCTCSAHRLYSKAQCLEASVLKTGRPAPGCELPDQLCSCFLVLQCFAGCSGAMLPRLTGRCILVLSRTFVGSSLFASGHCGNSTSSDSLAALVRLTPGVSRLRGSQISVAVPMGGVD